MNCEDFKNLLVIHLYGKLNSEVKNEFEQHLVECPTCANQFEQLIKQKTNIENSNIPVPDWENSWKIIFNSKQYPWGVNDAMEPMREASFDVISIDVPIQKLEKPVEQFTIAFDNSTDNLSLTMAWDTTKIVVPLK